MGFSKVFNNLYVTIRYKLWDDKHPYATLSQNIGSVDIVANFYEYQLYCKHLNISIQSFNKETNKLVKADKDYLIVADICKTYPQIEDRTSWETFTIDPDGCLDFDDGFSVKVQSNNQVLLSIYISNVCIWMDFLNLWELFTERISTIYLPDRKKPMLPSILSDSLCSLQQGRPRIAFTMDILFDDESNIISIDYTNTLIKIYKNYSYEEHLLLNNKNYSLLFETVKKMPNTTNVNDSHELVAHLMIFMNYHCALDFMNYNNGIFRATTNKEYNYNIPKDINHFIESWRCFSSQYVDKQKTDCIRHEPLHLDAYIHITSPIRRLVDLLNLNKFQQNHSLIKLTDNAYIFYDKWIQRLDYINITMQSIRKIQNECYLLETCYNNNEVLEKIYDGYCFDKILRNYGLYQFYVFLPEIKLATKIITQIEMTNYEKRQYKLYVFNNEEKFKRKVRLQLV